MAQSLNESNSKLFVITHKCGHIVDYRISSHRVDAQLRLKEWIEKKLCNECKKKE